MIYMSDRFLVIASFLLCVDFLLCEGACKNTEFECERTSKCIPLSQFCNGNDDCGDASDEPRKSNSILYENTTFCKSQTNNICILPPSLAERKMEICHGDGTCSDDEFECDDGSQCVALNQFCDGQSYHCRDLSDEPFRSSSINYASNTTFCKGLNGDLCVLPPQIQSRKDRMCQKSSTCNDNEFECDDGSQCVDLNNFCDATTYDCRDLSDEPFRKSSIDYGSNVTFCKSAKGDLCILPPRLLSRKDMICQKNSSCSTDEFECDDGSQCVPLKNFCDGTSYQCRDLSDEPLRDSTVNYPSNTTFCKSFAGDICVLPPRVLSKKDKICQKDSACSENEFQCTDGSKCINLNNFCDGRVYDCRDRSDEQFRSSSVTYNGNETFCKTARKNICILPPQLLSKKDKICQNESACTDDEYECLDGSQCISLSNFCDGKAYHCRDQSDEQFRMSSVTYPNDTNFCKNFAGDICVLPPSLYSRKHRICQNNSACSDEEFECSDGSRCIALSKFCDGQTYHCSDRSDEVYLANSEIRDDTAFCRSVYGLSCALPSSLSNKKTICRENGGCRNDLFKCDTTLQCVEVGRFCDQRADCSDNSDENLRFIPAMNRSDEEYCVLKNSSSGQICTLPKSLESRKLEICRKDSTCNNEEFECADGSQCIRKYQFCDGTQHCKDGSDEQYRNSSIGYGNDTTFCRPDSSVLTNICILPKNMISRKKGLCLESYKCKADELECADGSRCISMDRFCNGVNDCRDGSDEYTNSTYTDGRMCRVKTFSCDLPKRHRCDGIKNCDDGSDECLCDDILLNHFSSQSCFRCLSVSTNVIEHAKMCDGVIDCQDLSDECYCNSTDRIGICSKLRIETKDNSYMTCKAGSELNKIIPIHSVCDGRADCDDAIDEVNCRQAVAIRELSRKDRFVCQNGQVGIKCDGVPECPNFEEEECNDCSNPPEFCNHVQQLKSDEKYFECKNGSNTIFFIRELCDGKSTCPEGGDELGCSNRFYCTNASVPSIESSHRCNKIDECENRKDEENCGHFECKDKGEVKYLDQNKVCDGVKDCFGGSDECVKGCIKSAFSDEESMITSKSIMAFVWIFGVGALIGCVFVSIIAVQAIATEADGNDDRTGRHSKINKMLILSLTFSDLLVGIYALAICIKSAEFAGSYCKYDRAWRSSSTCSALGAILIIGSEQSVLTMVLLTTHRLFAVLRPMKLPNTSVVWVVLTITWLISIALGTVPIIPTAEDYFVDEITFDNWPLYSSVNRSEVKYLNQWLSLMHDESTLEKYKGLTNWNKLERLASDLNPSYKVAYKFGYYSTHTVCLPTLFPDRTKDFAWGYSLLLLLINFCAFIYMMVAYLFLYKKTARGNPASSKRGKTQAKKNRRMQKKLTIIVLTDFCCWMPVCIMGFLQLSGVDIPNDAYLPTGLLIIPINSALNPFIYSGLSDVMWDKTEFIRKWLRNFFSSKVGVLEKIGFAKHQNTVTEGSTTADHVTTGFFSISGNSDNCKP